MHAIRLHAFGPAENLTYEKTDDPEPGPGQVRISVRAAGVHLLDTALREGIKAGPAPAPVELPTIPGREVAGVVESLGEGTSQDWLGKRVVTHLGFAPGGYAELAVVDATRLQEIPAGLDEAEAVALIGTGRTAMGIVQFADLDEDSVVVIPAAAGGLGTFLVQYAVAKGATVIGLAGGERKTALVRENGADLAVDYLDPEWPSVVRAFLGADRHATVVFDGVGGETGRTAVGLLGRGGRHVVFGWTETGLGGGPVEFAEGELAARGVESVVSLGPAMMEKAGGDNPVRTLENRALALAAEGVLRPTVTRFPLAEAAAAHRALQERGTVGKVVLEP
ncbi:zinc-binding dehydrogenase [Streptomyces sp. TRM66268-LWL]|uniref:Zinc-binding dehydrogenase n=1 Tax=Streptomyces polyasparticus TaxID=2767826 RepID=A0ABR7SQG2_9ACTN|nr:zinc-binding dehydrogenase [Streptomyces polyasparticus]MBC9716563.1 zinc-binding dehydrogenase [Streptomyces polyasparticus]